MKMPSGRRAKSLARMALRIERGRERRSSPSSASKSKTYSCTSYYFCLSSLVIVFTPPVSATV